MIHPGINSSCPIKDEFRGDTDSLVRCIVALLEMDAKGVLVPHGVGGHARGLLSAAAVRLAAVPHAPAVTIATSEGWAIDKSTDSDILVYKGCSVIEDEHAHRVLALLAAAPDTHMAAPFAYTVRWSDAQPGEKPVILWPEQLARYGASMQREGHTLIPLYKGAELFAPFDNAQRRKHYEALLAQLEQEQRLGATVMPAEPADETLHRAPSQVGACANPEGEQQ